MPCTGGPYGDNNDISSSRDITRLKEKNEYLEACLCAIITELEKKDIAAEIILTAGKAGQVNIAKWWAEHKNDDVTRLTAEMRKFSPQEWEILRKILNKS